MGRNILQHRGFEMMSELEANKCLGEDDCKTCPRYLDDCDGKEDD